MQRFYSVLLTLLIFSNQLYAQSSSITRILSDVDRKNYVWAIGYGKTLEEADNDAMNALMNTDTNFTSVTKSKSTDVTTSTSSAQEEVFTQESMAISNFYLEDVCREQLPDEKGRKRVLRYVTREDWEARHDVLKGKVEEYIASGQYASNVEDKIRYYTWAHILLQTYPEKEAPIMIDETTYAKHWLVSQLRELLDAIEVNIIGIEQDKTNTSYPYKVFLDFVHDSVPIGYLRFGFFDGRGYVYDESVKDGRGVVQVKDVSTKLSLDIDCLYKDLARQLDPSVYVLLQNPVYASSFQGGHKEIEFNQERVKYPKSLNTAADGVESKVNEGLKQIEASYVEVKNEVASIKPYTQMMQNITNVIQKKGDVESIRKYFTDDAWKQYDKIVTSGNPILARTPEYKFINHDSLTICQSIPLKLTFSGNRSFIEDVVFRVNDGTMKIESVAYKLSAKTEQTIMSMGWDDKARLTLVAFLEDYRSAYCLMNLDYIEKVFAEDAYIIHGVVLKQSNRKFSDVQPHQYEGTKTVYYQNTKREYLDHLRRCFASKEFVNIRFEECNVAKGYYAKEGIYAVQVKQMYYSNNYADDGILTLAIDMRDEQQPLVRVRVWQQERDVTYDAEQMIDGTVRVANELH